ncbi:TonB family protein [uncultured Sulfuricurvum sp.]|uniref:TonB family protein n=2 Tax=Sulfuricurvum sp. TaxID=2025608 RepID=UPI002639AA1D|nr:TonB family protein [uncultured Sulfuricurvum sp.]
MKKSFLGSLLVHLLLVLGAIGLIHKPYDVETVTIPLTMPMAFETATLSDPTPESIQKPAARPKEIHTPHPIAAHTVHTAPSAQPQTHTENIVQTQTAPSALSEAISEPATSAPVQPESDTLSQAHSPTVPAASTPIDPNLKANFEIIRKKTFERLYYPQDAQNALKEGTATVIYKLSEAGVVESIVLEHSTGYPDLDEIVLKAAHALQGEQLRSVEKRINIRLSIEFTVTNKAA